MDITSIIIHTIAFLIGGCIGHFGVRDIQKNASNKREKQALIGTWVLILISGMALAEIVQWLFL